MTEITGILTAAGFSSRFGSSKLLVEMDGRALIELSAAALEPCDSIIAVVAATDHCLQSVVSGLGIECVLNTEPARGLAYSIACGVRASAQSTGWCILPADMPGIKPSTTLQIVNALRAGEPLVAPAYQGKRGHPVGFSAGFYAQLAALDGDRGARHILQQHIKQLKIMPCDDAGVLYDIDTPADLQQALATYQRS